eukprot:gene2457-2793_t
MSLVVFYNIEPTDNKSKSFLSYDDESNIHGTLQLQLKFPDDFTHSIKVSIGDTIQATKKRLSEEFGMDQTSFDFMLGEKVMINPLSFNDFPQIVKVFKLVYDPENARNAEFERLAAEHGTLFGYHGSANENWNNILRGRGFSSQYISEDCLFGQGFYFSSDSKVSHSFVKMGRWWDRSVMGSRVGCLSACEIVDSLETLRGVKPLHVVLMIFALYVLVLMFAGSNRSQHKRSLNTKPLYFQTKMEL